MNNKPLANDVDINKLAEELDGYTGADIQAISEEATLLTIRNAVPSINEKKLKIQDYNNQLKVLREEQSVNMNVDLEKEIKDLEIKIEKIQSQLVDNIALSKEDFNVAMVKILKGADRAKRANDKFAKEAEGLYR